MQTAVISDSNTTQYNATN